MAAPHSRFLRTKANRFGALYRAYDKHGRLLYIGSTDSPGGRHGSHRREREWWSRVHHVDWQFFETIGGAIDAERDALERESPKYNKAGVA
jgi:hypothetical protein